MNEAKEVLVKYYSPKHLLTIDTELLFDILFKALGHQIRVIFEEMSPEEKKAASSVVDGGLVAIENRLIICSNFEGAFIRELEIEKAVEKPGRR